MNISFAVIKAALVAEDMEGLIASGAPDDEYDAEAEKIAASIAKLKSSQRSEAAMHPSLGWFGRSLLAFHRTISSNVLPHSSAWRSN